MNYDKLIRRLRNDQRLFGLETTKIDRVLVAAKRRMLEQRKQIAEAVGPYSGLTRRELRASGTCEPDWY